MFIPLASIALIIFGAVILLVDIYYDVFVNGADDLKSLMKSVLNIVVGVALQIVALIYLSYLVGFLGALPYFAMANIIAVAISVNFRNAEGNSIDILAYFSVILGVGLIFVS